MLCKALFLAERNTDGAVKNLYYCARRPSFKKGWGCCYSGKGSRLEKMTVRHNRFLNIDAVDQILSRVEAIVRRINPGAGNELLSQLQEAETRIRKIRRFLPRNQY